MGSLPLLIPRPLAASRRAARMGRLPWRFGVCFESYGVRVGVRSNEGRLLEQLSPHLPPQSRQQADPSVDLLFSLWVRRGVVPPATRARLYLGDRRLGSTTDRGRALEALESAIRLKIAETCPDRVFVHAGVVGWRGRAIVIPGRSRSGKTTLVSELVKAGASYLSDEFAPLDAEGRVHPFAKPLTIREPRGCDVHARRCGAEELGGCVGSEPLPIGLVAFPEYRPGAPWRPATLTHGQGVLAMLAHTVPARLRPETALDTLARALAGATLLRGARGEAGITARLLIETLEGRAPAPDAPAEAP